MDFLSKYISFPWYFMLYLKGCNKFHCGPYVSAIKLFDKCSRHQSFNNELLFSYYGQSLCAVDELELAHPYLVKACKIYELRKWEFDEKYSFDLAQNTLDALRHICSHTDIDVGRDLSDVKLKLKIK